MKEHEHPTKNTPETEPAQDEVARKAYAIYLKEGRPEGHAEQNWLEAEAQMPHAGSDHPGDHDHHDDHADSLWSDPREFFRMSPFAMMRRMQDEMDRMMGGLGSGAGQQMWSPAIEVSERGGNLVVCAELPGLDKDNLKVEATDDALIIEGERRREHEEKQEGYFRSERSYGSFRRAVPLPDYAKAEDARATFDNGVLEVTIPLAEDKARRRRIEIGSGAQRKPGASETSAAKEERKTG